MLLQRFHLYCQRIDDAGNMARYYALSIQPTLLGEVAVVRCWGGIGARGGEKLDLFSTETEGATHFSRSRSSQAIEGLPTGEKR